jgi:hypothetical protein
VVAANVLPMIAMQYQLYASIVSCLLMRLSYIVDEKYCALLKRVVY